MTVRVRLSVGGAARAPWTAFEQVTIPHARHGEALDLDDAVARWRRDDDIEHGDIGAGFGLGAQRHVAYARSRQGGVHAQSLICRRHEEVARGIEAGNQRLCPGRCHVEQRGVKMRAGKIIGEACVQLQLQERLAGAKSNRQHVVPARPELKVRMLHDVARARAGERMASRDRCDVERLARFVRECADMARAVFCPVGARAGHPAQDRNRIPRALGTRRIPTSTSSPTESGCGCHVGEFEPPPGFPCWKAARASSRCPVPGMSVSPPRTRCS